MKYKYFYEWFNQSGFKNVNQRIKDAMLTAWDVCVNNYPTNELDNWISVEEINLTRQWFDAVKDLSSSYLTVKDYRLAKKIYKKLNMRVPFSIQEQIPQPPKQSTKKRGGCYPE